MNLFTYGTLMCEDIFIAVSATSVPRTLATLHDYTRLCVKNEVYPALVPRQGGRVDGVIYQNIPSSAWRRLDRFEGNMYVRRSIQAHLSSGETIVAETYVARAEVTHCLVEMEWDFASFIDQYKEQFYRTYSGFLTLS